MDRFRRFCRSAVRVAAFSALLLRVAAAHAEDQPTNPPAATSAPTTVKPAAPAKLPAEKKPQPKPTITAKKEGEGILGKQVYGPTGADMGLVTNVLVDHTGNPIAAVIDFGGFLGMGSRKIAVDWHLMQFHPGDKNKSVILNLEKGQLKAAPTYDPDKPPKIVGAPAPQPAAKTKPARAPTPAPTAPSSNDNPGK